MKSSRLRFFGVASALLGLAFGSVALSASAQGIPELGFESGDFTNWSVGGQTGSLSGSTISGNGVGVNIISGNVTFNASSHGAVGSPTLPGGEPNPYYAPSVEPVNWTFGPFGNYAALLQPRSGVFSVSFDNAISALGLTATQSASLRSMLSSQASASGYGSGTPTNASWITTDVTLSAGTVYTMSWNYIGTDYVPFNDGSITSLVPTDSTSSASTTVNNQSGNYALLGFTNPGTGDYSTGTYGSTGWQVSTYEVSEDGIYTLGFAVFNLDDTMLSPVLLIDSNPGTTLKNGEQFGAVAPNNPNAPTVAPTSPPSTESPTTTETPAPTDAPTTIPLPIFIPVPTTVDEPIETTVPVSVGATTTLPTTETPNTVPVGTDVPQLPETGSASLDYASVALIFLLTGLLLLAMGQVRKEV